MAVKESVPQDQTQKGEASEATRHTCAHCGELSGSISAGTGRPLLLDKETGRWEHVNCRPTVGLAMLERMGA